MRPPAGTVFAILILKIPDRQGDEMKIKALLFTVMIALSGVTVSSMAAAPYDDLCGSLNTTDLNAGVGSTYSQAYDDLYAECVAEAVAFCYLSYICEEDQNLVITGSDYIFGTWALRGYLEFRCPLP
jgi:hypothetical protein